MVADNLDEAAYLVGTAICPHRLRVNEPPRKSLAFLSSLDLGACGLTSLKYGFDVDSDAGSIEDSYLVKWTLAGEGRLQCGDRTAITSPRYASNFAALIGSLRTRRPEAA
jgi:AraC-binding-like domain